MIELVGNTRATIPAQTLIDEISRRNWTVTKVTFDKAANGFKAKAKGPTGDEVEKVGPDAATALSALLHFIIRKEFIRQPTVAQFKVGAWKTTWVDQLQEIADAYAKAPVFDQKAASAWKALADDCVIRAKVIQEQVHVEVVENPDPYKTSQEMFKDVHEKKHIFVTRANAEHPVWTVEQVCAFRLCSDVLAHTVSGGDFTWHGTNLAAAAYLPLLNEEMQKACFVEMVGTSAYSTVYRAHGPEKIAFLDDFLAPVADEENAEGHSGIHPEDTKVPMLGPKVSGVRRDPNYKHDSGMPPLNDNAYLWQGDPLGLMDTQANARHLDTKWWTWKDSEGKQDFGRMKQAVTNAFRAVMLSPGKGLQANAQHYQDLANVPYHVDDPKVYHNTLERSRANHNAAKGQHPDSHKPHAEDAKAYVRWFVTNHPDLPYEQAEAQAERNLFNFQVEEEEKVMADKGDSRAEDIEKKALGSLRKRLKAITKPQAVPGQDLPHRFSEELTKPQILEAPGEINRHWDDERRPFFYAPERNRVYLGQYGQYHQDVADEFGLPYSDFMKSGLELHGGHISPSKPQQIGFFDLAHSVYPQVIHALAEHEGIKSPLSPAWQEENQVSPESVSPIDLTGLSDHFSSSWDDESWQEDIPEQYLQTQTIQPWQVGQLGKGLLLANGQLYIWSTNNLGEPHHDDVASRQGINYVAKVDIRPDSLVAITSPDATSLSGVDRDTAEELLAEAAPKYGLRFMPGFTAKRRKRPISGDFHTEGTEVDPTLRPFHGGPTTGNGTRAISKGFSTIGESIGGIAFEHMVHKASLADSGDSGYGAYQASHLKSIAALATNADVLTKAALEDIKNHDAKGWHFRSTVLDLGIRGVGPQQASFAWQLLCPMTSQLATVDSHMLEALGHKPDEMNSRDYFKFERELAAGRDASGYSHMPLGQFAGALWDHKRTGEGSHMNHSALRVDNPTHHSLIDWEAPKKSLIPDGMYLPPNWWQATLPHRQQAGQDFDEKISPGASKSEYPFKDEQVAVHTPLIYHSGESKDEFHVALGLPEHVTRKIHEWAKQLNLKDADVTPPEDYHITLAYAPHGYGKEEAHEIVEKHNLAGMKFRAKGLDHFNPENEGEDGAVVLRLDSPKFNEAVLPLIDKLKEAGLEVSEFDGGPKAHVTLAYASELPEADSPLALEFRAEAPKLSRPRGLAKKGKPIVASHQEPPPASLPGEPCYLHSWIDCPLCALPKPVEYAEHNPKLEPTDNFDQASREWYDTVKEPGLENPPDPFGDLKGPTQSSKVATPVGEDYWAESPKWNDSLYHGTSEVQRFLYQAPTPLGQPALAHINAHSDYSGHELLTVDA